MKKNKIIILALSLLFCVGTLPAQSDDANVEKKEKKNFVLPQAGDISLGIDVVPMFKYIGNFFNGSTDNSYNSFGGAPIFNSNPFVNPSVSIMGKYMITDNIFDEILSIDPIWLVKLKDVSCIENYERETSRDFRNDVRRH